MDFDETTSVNERELFRFIVELRIAPRENDTEVSLLLKAMSKGFSLSVLKFDAKDTNPLSSLILVQFFAVSQNKRDSLYINNARFSSQAPSMHSQKQNVLFFALM